MHHGFRGMIIIMIPQQGHVLLPLQQALLAKLDMVSLPQDSDAVISLHPAKLDFLFRYAMLP